MGRSYVFSVYSLSNHYVFRTKKFRMGKKRIRVRFLSFVTLCSSQKNLKIAPKRPFIAPFALSVLKRGNRPLFCPLLAYSENYQGVRRVKTGPKLFSWSGATFLSWIHNDYLMNTYWIHTEYSWIQWYTSLIAGLNKDL